MLLKDKVAIVYGGGGAIGGASARAFAREGAKVFIAGRTPARLEAVAADIRKAGGTVATDVVDAQDEDAINDHADRVVAKVGRIDVALNAVSVMHVQGRPLADLSFDEYSHPISAYTRTNFITAKAVARHMVKQGSGVILTLSTPGALVRRPGYLAYGVTCGAIETFSRLLAVELGSSGVRVICMRPDAIPDALPVSYSRELFDDMTARMGTTTGEWLVAHAREDTLLGRLPRLEQVADYAAFIASDRAGAVTATLANLTCGSVLD